MEITLEEKSKLIELSEIASGLLVKVIDEILPEEEELTKNDMNFKKVISQIYDICPLLSDSYMLMYNHIQKEKLPPDNLYLKQLKKQDYEK
jgi:hypothetical protein